MAASPVESAACASVGAAGGAMVETGDERAVFTVGIAMAVSLGGAVIVTVSVEPETVAVTPAVLVPINETVAAASTLAYWASPPDAVP